MPKLYDRDALETIIRDLESGSFQENAGTILGKRYNQHHLSTPDEVGALATFQAIVRPSLLEHRELNTLELMKKAISCNEGITATPPLWQILDILDEVKLLNQRNEYDKQLYSLTLRGQEFDPSIEIYRSHKTRTGCLGSLVTGSATTYGLWRIGAPLYLSIGAFGAGGMAANSLRAYADAITAQSRYDRQAED